jgi:glycosyltransferase involved in cell wall biosynthesis
MLMARPRVSIITPTYNHAAFIAQCIDSVLLQSYGDWEMVIIDDGSTDATGEIAQSYTDSRIRYVRQPHQGIFALGRTYNDALSLAKGEIIAILEGDDFWPPHKLAAMVPSFDDPGVVLAFGIGQIVASDGALTGEFFPSETLLSTISPASFRNDPVGSAVHPVLMPDGLPTHSSTILVRRSVLEGMGGFLTVGDGHAVDTATFVNLALRGRFAFTKDVMGFYRFHMSNVSRGKKGLKFYVEDYWYLRTFARQHRKQLRLSDKDLRAIGKAWERILPSMLQQCVEEGRSLLRRRRWREASEMFRWSLTLADGLSAKAYALRRIFVHVAGMDSEWFWRSRVIRVLDVLKARILQERSK